tara:strand:- start:108 stop:428 length:321 start_codon:yes stop_codon:yes gene_type:complete
LRFFASTFDGFIGLSETRRRRIEVKLGEKLETTSLEVVDESHLHAGHAGAQSGAGHFSVVIESEKFRGMTRLAAQRLVYEALSEEMGKEIHALRIKTSIPACRADS